MSGTKTLMGMSIGCKQAGIIYSSGTTVQYTVKGGDMRNVGRKTPLIEHRGVQCTEY
jgi:hypothetical protein